MQNSFVNKFTPINNGIGTPDIYNACMKGVMYITSHLGHSYYNKTGTRATLHTQSPVTRVFIHVQSVDKAAWRLVETVT